MTVTSTLLPEPKSLKIPASMASFTRSIACWRCVNLRYRHVFAPLCFKDGHSGHGAAAHGDVGQLVCGAVRGDGVELGAVQIEAAEHERSANLALVSEQHLLEHGHGGVDAAGAAGQQAVQSKFGRDEGGGELCVGGRAGSAAVHVRGEVVDLLAVLVGHDGALCRARVCAQHQAVLVDQADDGCAR